MIDLTQITTPFGLLDEETQVALMAHGGPYERYEDEGSWLLSEYPQWYLGSAYRVKLAPPKPRECWSFGKNFCDTEAEASDFRNFLAYAYPNCGYGDCKITRWREVL